VAWDGTVVDQWTDMSRRDADGDEPMVEVIKIAFTKKTITNCTWDAVADRRD
jgi:hypothetical protein